MVIKKYIAITEEEAIKMAKAELGEDAVIMNTKQKQPKGIMKWFQKPSVEITAAVDDMPREPEVQNDMPDFSKLQEAIRETNAVLEADARKKQMEQQEKQSEKQNEQQTERFRETKIITEEKEKESDTRHIEERLNSLQDLLQEQMQSAKEEQEEKGKEDTNQAYFDLIRKKLIDNEVEETYVDQILDDIAESVSQNANLDSILAGVYQKIVLKIGQPHLIDIKSKKTKYVFFIGPTGVGKTTTIAKIASTLKLTKKTKVALITSDTYRIAAVEQLRTYANILGIPLQVVYSAEDMEHAMEELREFDLVFVDTAGRSHNNQEQREDIQKLMETVPEENREVFLVLSATTKYKDLVKIATTYSEITKYNLIFTKLDETDTIGNIFNIHMMTGAPLSYTTWGQNVPDDIGKIDAQNIAKQLLGGNS
ncbi:MAG: flagellar biosynthesis protein FlhF [Butyribacter sp.]|nr:flagellar biosynthesis protein FlhF [bacterium]MDY3855247.1 flagellar biosynthesis protein FlhF [Butyribacter sp.]